MPEFNTSEIVIDVPILAKECLDFFVFANGVNLKALGFMRGLDTIRLILSHPGLYMPADRAADAIPLGRARVKYPFLFFASETNPLLYRGF